jgi:hypothetical protein
MLKPTVRNLYQFMSTQASLHDCKAAKYFSPSINCKFLLVKTRGNCFRVDFVLNELYVLRIIKDCIVQTQTSIPKYDETRIYKGGIQVNN